MTCSMRKSGAANSIRIRASCGSSGMHPCDVQDSLEVASITVCTDSGKFAKIPVHFPTAVAVTILTEVTWQADGQPLT